MARAAAIHTQSLAHHGVQTWRDDVAVLVLAGAAALFVVAGVVRLARWRLARDPHSALVGSAQIVMGGLFLPLLGIAEVGGALQHRDLAEALLRLLAWVVTAALVIRAVHCSGVHRLERPGRLLPLLACLVLGTFAGLAVAEKALSQPVPHGAAAARALSIAMTAGWLALAAAVRTRAPGRPWSRRAAPSLCALALAEGLYGREPGDVLGTAAALAVCAAVAALAVRSANLDLEGALHDTERTIGSLSRTLREARGQAVELTEWRDHLVHDADNAVAGLRAALDVLDARQGGGDAPTARLCRAAAEEVRHLDHLLHRSADAPTTAFDVTAVVRRVALTAAALGQDVRFRGDPAVATGRPEDLVAALKNLLVNAARHAPGSPIELFVEHGSEVVRIVCQDHGPGPDPRTVGRMFDRGVRGPASAGSGLGLYEARAVMREQGGDLLLEPRPSGARFVATLPALPHLRGRSLGIPTQRCSPAQDAPARMPGSVVG